MHKKLILLWLLSLPIFLFPVLGQELLDSRQSGYFTYVFKINEQEARQIYTKGFSAINDSFLYHVVDSFPAETTWKGTNSFGHYLLCHPIGNHMSILLHTQGNIHFKLLNNKVDLAFVLYNSQGELIQDAQVTLKGKTIRYDEKAGLYQLKKSEQEGVLEVNYNGLTYFFTVQHQKEYNRTSFTRRLFYYSPLHLTWRPFYDVYRSVRYFYPYGYVYLALHPFQWNKRSYRARHTGFLVTNKPKFQPQDTLKLKAFIISRKGKLVNQPLNLRLNGYFGGPSKLIGTVAPYRPGCYEYSFVLSDSLKLQLDKKYFLTLEKEEHKDLLSGGFEYAAYELKGNSFQLRSKKSFHEEGEPMVIYLRGSDENELNLMDVKAKVNVYTQIINDNNTESIYIADHLWQHELKLDPIGETALTLPDSIFPKANINYTVNTAFLTSDYQREVQTLSLQYSINKGKITFNAENDSLEIAYLVSGKKTLANGLIKIYGENAVLLNAYNSALPAKIKLLPHFYRIEVVTEGKKDEFMNYGHQPEVNCNAYRTKDSVFVQISNPAKIPLWYTITKHNKVIKSGSTNEDVFYQGKSSGSKNYYVDVRYLWAGIAHEFEHEIPFDKNKLDIKINQPNIVYPGQKAEVEIEVKDALGKPVANADITTYGFTKKFTAYEKPKLPAVKHVYHPKKRLGTYRHYSNNKPYKAYLNYQKWKYRMGLDSITYYKFIYPEKEVFTASIPAKTGITQISPYVVTRGHIEPVKVVTIDEIPVYYHAAQGDNRYSFAVSPGKHKVEIRTQRHKITLHDVEVNEGEKLILSVDPEKIKTGITVKPMPLKLDEIEQRFLEEFLMEVEHDYLYPAYILQKNRVYFLNPDFHRTTGNFIKKNTNLLIGPILYDSASFTLKDQFAIDFSVEPRYGYAFYPKLIKMTHTPRHHFLSAFSSNYPNAFTFNEEVVTEQEINTLWEDYKFALALNRYQNLPVSTTIKERGSLKIKFANKGTINDKQIFKLLLLKHGQPDFMKIYEGSNRAFNNLEPGYYRLVGLVNQSAYFIIDSLQIRPNGTLYHYTPIPELSFENILSTGLLPASFMDKAFYETLKQGGKIEQPRINYRHNRNNVTGIVGRVTSFDDGSELPGVNVFIKGTRIGTITDLDGYFVINAQPRDILVFSYIGYSTEEALVRSSAMIEIELMTDIQSLSDVVVIGYGEAPKAGSNRMRSRELEINVQLDNNKVSPKGSTPSLIILNGLPYHGKEEDIPREQIVKRKFIKGEEAVKLYGSTAAQGVLLIYTQTQDPTANLSDFPLSQASSLRNNFSDYTYWQPKLKTDKNGKTRFEVKYPDDVTSWRTFVLAMNGKKGSAGIMNEIKSYKTTMAQMAVPRFLIEGDTAVAIGKITNYTLDTTTINIGYQVNDQLHFSKTEKIFTSVIDTLQFTTTGNDSIKLAYYLQKTDGYQDGELRYVPVYAQGSLENIGTFHILEKEGTYRFPIADKDTKVTVSGNFRLLNVLLEEIDHVVSYRYLCNEQTASKLKALLWERRIRLALGQSFTKDDMVRKLIQKLENAQNSDGSWGWWPEGRRMNWITTHVAEAITEAYMNGYKVNIKNEALKNLYLKQLQEPTFEDKITALKVLQLLNAQPDFKGTLDEIEQSMKLSFYQKLELVHFRQTLGLPYQLDTESLMAKRKTTMLGNYYWGQDQYVLHDNAYMATLLVYKILQDHGGHENVLEKIRYYFLENRKDGFWRNTYESACILETILPDILKNQTKIEHATLEVNGKQIHASEQFPFSVESIGQDTIVVKKTGNQPVFISISQQYHNSKPGMVDSLFTITTSFAKNSSNTINLKAGEPTTLLAKVHVKRKADYVMIDLPIPAGCSYESKEKYYGVEDHRSYYHEKVSIFCSGLEEGVYSFEVQLMPRYSGTYTVNPAKAELMYFPIFYGRGEMKQVRIKEAK
jgi:alpha-2-macroglobulin